MGWNYTDKTKQLFMDAVQGKPGTHLGEIENPDGVGEHGSIACGDALRFMFRTDAHPTDPTQDRIVEARYQTFGCTSAIAASEALCALIENGRFTPIQALKVTNKDIVEYLGGLPAQKVHCSVMGAEALEAAVYNWSQRRGVDLSRMGIHLGMKDEEEGRIVCKCFSISEPYLRRKIRELNLHSIPEITAALKAGGACGSCHHAPGGLQDLLDETWSGTAPKPEAAGAAATENSPYGNLSVFQFMKKVDRTLEEQARPALRADGGDVELVDIKGFDVFCRLMGTCSGCPGATATLKMLVEGSLKEHVDERIRVIAI